MTTFYFSDRIIVIIWGNNSNKIHRSRLVKFSFNLSASASTSAPSEPILLQSKKMTKCKINRLIIAIINKNKNFGPKKKKILIQITQEINNNL